MKHHEFIVIFPFNFNIQSNELDESSLSNERDTANATSKRNESSSGSFFFSGVGSVELTRRGDRFSAGASPVRNTRNDRASTSREWRSVSPLERSGDPMGGTGIVSLQVSYSSGLVEKRGPVGAYWRA